MAASSYYQLDPMPASDFSAPPNLYSGKDYDTPHSNAHEMGPKPVDDAAHSDAYHSQHRHPIEFPSKPLVQETSTQLPRPLILSSTPNNRLHQRKYQRWRRYLRVCKILTKIITTIFASIMFGIMIFIIIRYQTTKSTLRNGRNPWPREPKLWPTFMLLAGAGVTLLLSIATLLAYLFCYDMVRRSWKLTIVKYAIHILTWIIISTLYRYEKSLHGNDNDLWGWACSQERTAIQQEFRGVVSFTPLCDAQVSMFY